jgi:protein TonB
LSSVATQPAITPVDRFGLTLTLAIIIHAIIILGITFTSEDKQKPRFDTMEIVLVQQKDLTPPEDAKLLAQANLQGGTEKDSRQTPAAPLPPPFPDQVPEVTAQPVVETQPAPATKPIRDQQVTAEPRPEDKDLLTARGRKAEVPKPKPVPETAKKQPEKARTSAADLLMNSFKIASLSAEIKQRLESRSSRPRRTFISASTKIYKYAAYMEAWRAKVERVGNLNYPDEARRRKLTGSLILDVALNPDGTVNEITIRRSSGHKVLDDAAIRIVRLASPYAPFPDNIKADTDILHITRTWQFLNNSAFQ